MEYRFDDSVDVGDDDLRIVKLCYMYASLRGNQNVGLPLSHLERVKMQALERLLVGDPLDKRRLHRRITTLLPATLMTSTEQQNGIMLNISGTGMYISTEMKISVGGNLHVFLTRPGKPKFIFPCLVQREEMGPHSPGLGLCFHSIPTKQLPE